MCGPKREVSPEICPNYGHRELVYDDRARLGHDVRDLKMAGYSDDEINQVLFGRKSLEELLRSKAGSVS